MDKIKREWLLHTINKLSVLKKTLLSTEENGYLGKRVYEVELHDGSKRTVEQITKNKENGDAVVIMPITKNQDFVMIVESRPNTKDNVAISFPAGMVDYEESKIDAARRELLEETGYSCEHIEELEWHYQDQGCSSAIITIFLATGCERVAEQHLDGYERLEKIEFTPDEVRELIEEGRINGANTKLALYTYALRRKKD